MLSRALRDSILFLGGLAGLAYEAVIHDGSPRLELLPIYAAMMGLPAFLGLDRRERDREAARNDDPA